MPERVSYTSRLRENLQRIENQMMELLDVSTVMRFRNDPNSGLFFVTAPYYWGETDDNQKRLLIKLKKDYDAWFEHLTLLFLNPPNDIKRQIEETHKFVLRWIERNQSDYAIEPTVELNKATFKERIQPFYSLLQMIEDPKGHETILIPDTNALIFVPDFVKYSKVAGLNKYTMVIVPTVLAELDKLKVQHRDLDFRNKVGSVIRRIKGLRQQGSLLEGVTVNKTVTIKTIAKEPDFDTTLQWLDPNNEDDRIIASVLEVQRSHPSATTVLVTDDINLQNKAEMANLPFSEPPEPDKVMPGDGSAP